MSACKIQYYDISGVQVINMPLTSVTVSMIAQAQGTAAHADGQAQSGDAKQQQVAEAVTGTLLLGVIVGALQGVLQSWCWVRLIPVLHRVCFLHIWSAGTWYQCQEHLRSTG